MTRKRLRVAVRALVLGSLLLPLASCSPGTESARKVESERVRNGLRGDGFAGIGDSQDMAMGLATSLFNDVMHSMFGYRPLDPIAYAEKDPCTPRDRNNRLINPSLAGCVYTYNPVWTANMKFGKASQSQSDHNAKQWDNDFKTHMANFLPMRHNFREHSLNGATFKDINLRGDDISGAVQPAGETFAGTNVTGARSYAADFVGADFTGATFSNASFRGVSLYGAKLSGLGNKITTLGDLSQSELDAADLSGLDLRQVNLPAYNTEGANLSRTNLSAKNMSGMFLHGVNFSDANLTGANLSNVFAGRNFANDLDRYGYNVPVTNFSNANLVNANLAGGRFTLVNFNGADLRGVNFSGAKLNGATFTGARFGCIGDKCTNFTGADLGCATWVLANQQQVLSDCSNSSNTNMVRTDLSGFDLQNVIFDGATLDATLFNGANLKRASFAKASGRRQPQFENVDISGANFRGAYFSGIRLINAKATCLIDVCTDFTDAFFESRVGGQETAIYSLAGKSSDFSGAYFNNANLFEARVQSVNFTNASFQCAQLRSRTFVGNNLQAADLSGAFTDADIVVPATAGDRPRNEGTPAALVAVTCPAPRVPAVPNPPRALPPVPPVPPTFPFDNGTCRAGGVCKVGNIGPGGGYVFYVSPTPINFAAGISNGGIYLEMAYKGWDDLLPTTNDPANRYIADPQLRYECRKSGTDEDQGNNDSGIGFGAINTKKLLETACSATDRSTLVGRIANATISKVSDWFMPSADELELMAKIMGAPDRGGFFPNRFDGMGDNYASSTQGPPDAIFNSRIKYIARSMPGVQDGVKYAGGKVFFRDKYNQNGTFDYARPIRAFSPTDWSEYESETGTSGGVSVATTNVPTVSSSSSTTIPAPVTTVPRTTIPAPATTVKPTTTTQVATTTIATPAAVPLVNSTFSPTGGGWIGTGFTLGSGCKAGGGNPSLGTWNANALSFGYTNQTVTQSVVVPKPGTVTFTVSATVRGDRTDGFFSFALADANENVSSGKKTGATYVKKSQFELSVTTTAVNERITISITGGTTGTAWAGCYGPVIESANLTVTSK